MRRASLVLALSTAAAAVGVAVPAGAQAPAPTGSNAACGTTADTTGLTFNSTHNTADKTQIQCLNTGNATLVLTAVPRLNGVNPTPPPVTETSLGSGVYLASTGEGNPAGSGLAVWNFNFAALPGATTPSNAVFDLFVDQDASANTLFAEFRLPITGDTGLQDSENKGVSFGFSPLGFDPNANGEYTFQLAEFEGGSQVGDRLSINVITGTGPVTATPEPASLVLMGTGLVGLGGFVRRRNKRNAA